MYYFTMNLCLVHVNHGNIILTFPPNFGWWNNSTFMSPHRGRGWGRVSSANASVLLMFSKTLEEQIFVRYSRTMKDGTVKQDKHMYMYMLKLIKGTGYLNAHTCTVRVKICGDDKCIWSVLMLVQLQYAQQQAINMWLIEI